MSPESKRVCKSVTLSGYKTLGSGGDWGKLQNEAQPEGAAATQRHIRAIFQEPLEICMYMYMCVRT